MEDQVFSIREAATLNLAALAQGFGEEWARDHLVPPVLLAPFNLLLPCRTAMRRPLHTHSRPPHILCIRPLLVTLEY